MHATGPINRSQTTGSMVAEIRKGEPPTIWLTGTSMPCLSIYKPYFFGGDQLTGELPLPGTVPDESLWWRVEKLHRYLCLDYYQAQQQIQAERKELQWDLLYKEWDLIHKKTGLNELNLFSKKAFLPLSVSTIDGVIPISS